MSAYKTATIRLGEAEYQRLREAEEQLRLITLQNHNTRTRASEPQTDTIYDRMVKDQKKRDLAFQSFQTDISDVIGSVEDRTHRLIQQQAAHLQKQIDKAQDSSFDRVQDQIEGWLENIQQQIIVQQNHQQSLWAAQDLRIASMEEREQHLREHAGRWIRAAQDLIEFITSQYELDAEQANELAYQQQAIDLAIQQYESGIFELSAMAAFQSFLQSSRLNAYLEAEEKARLIKVQALEHFAAFTINHLRENQIVSAMDNEGNLLDDTLDVNYWTGGKYLKLMSMADRIYNEMSSLSYMKTNEIQFYETNFKDIENQSVELTTQARLSVLASQLRFNVAQIIVKALEGQGFFLEQASYQHNDYRDAFIATTRNFSGNEVVVTLDPDAELEEGGRLQISSTDAGEITQHELFQRNREIFAAIESQGLNVDDIQTFDHIPSQDKVNGYHQTYQTQIRNSIGLEN